MSSRSSKKHGVGALFGETPAPTPVPAIPPTRPPSTYAPVVDRDGDGILVSVPGSTAAPLRLVPADPATARGVLFWYDGRLYAEGAS